MSVLGRMKERCALLYNIVLLLFVVASSGILWCIIAPSHHRAVKITDSYDVFATDVIDTKFSELGTQRYKLSSPRLNHYKINNRTYIDAPLLYLYNNNQQESWLITAQYATATQGKRTIQLIQHVNIAGSGTLNHKNTQLLTEKIIYYPEQNTAHTPLAVTIVQPGSMIHATGMDVDFNLGTISLLEKISGSYNPNVYP